MTGRRVVVTGIGTINPLGNSIEEYFSNLEKGVSGAAPITHFDAEKFKTRFACEVKNYDPTRYFDRKEVRKYDLFTQYALIAAEQAVADSALDLEKVDKEQVGVIWSSGIGGLKSFFDECLGYAAGDGTPRFSPFFIPRMIADIAAGFISMKYGFMGPNYCTVSACASSNHGMIAAMEAIRYGKADVMVTGGSSRRERAFGGRFQLHAGAFDAQRRSRARFASVRQGPRRLRDRRGRGRADSGGVRARQGARGEDLLRDRGRRRFGRRLPFHGAPSRGQGGHEGDARRHQGRGITPGRSTM